jgi:hypothetical protein
VIATTEPKHLLDPLVELIYQMKNIYMFGPWCLHKSLRYALQLTPINYIMWVEEPMWFLKLPRVLLSSEKKESLISLDLSMKSMKVAEKRCVFYSTHGHNSLF